MYYPEQRAIANLTTIRRDVNLPDESTGVVRVKEGKRVDVRDVVANGVIPTGYVMLNGAGFFGLRKPENLAELMLVEVGDFVDEGVAIAGKHPERGKRLFAPVKGFIALVDNNGYIIMQQTPRMIDMEAGVRGRVASLVQGRGVTIEATGTQIHGLWGNGNRIISTLRMEPEGGLNRAAGDVLEMRFMGTVVVTRSPLTMQSFQIMQEQSFSGIIAPSMDSSLIETALQVSEVILLTEGFGDARMNTTTYNLLEDYDGQQATIDAQMPNRWEPRYPEIIINRQTRDGDRPTRPNVMLTLRTGMTVHLMREPHKGMNGRILDLPKSPMLLDNGLRVPSALVELVTGETIYVPLANLEVLSR